jgi:hypothetical protein
MSFLKTSIKVIAIGMVSLNIVSCSSDSTPAGSSVPNVGTVTVEGKNYAGTFSRTSCVGSSTGLFNIGLSQGSASGEIVTAIVVLGDTPTGNKTYNVIENGVNFSASDANIITSVSTLSGTQLQTKTYRSTSGTVQASVEGGKVVVKFSNVSAKIYDQANKEIGKTIMAGNIKCD